MLTNNNIPITKETRVIAIIFFILIVGSSVVTYVRYIIQKDFPIIPIETESETTNLEIENQKEISEENTSPTTGEEIN